MNNKTEKTFAILSIISIGFFAFCMVVILVEAILKHFG
tara:strand:- start:352 stop:465 length:114 start_codon:yes stop_codon:yes gene_type:complete